VFDDDDAWTWLVRVLARVSFWEVSAVLSAFEHVNVPWTVVASLEEHEWELTDAVEVDAKNTKWT